MSVNDITHSDHLNWNRKVYHRLKLALSLNLRRQVFLAVSDNLSLRNQVAARLHSTLAYPVAKVLYEPVDGYESSTPAYPRLVTLRLNLNNPNPIDHINQWLSNYPPPIISTSKDTPGKPFPVPMFQIVGVEQLTKQPVAIQRLFLHYLRLTDENYSSPQPGLFLESSLLLWVTRPWLSAIEHSAPQFWRWRTGVFVFAGEPTPSTQGHGVPESSLGSRNGDVEDINPSVVDELVMEAETYGPSAQELNFQDDLQVPVESPRNHPAENQKGLPLAAELLPDSRKQQKSSEQPSLGNQITDLSFPHINQQLIELIITTINTSPGENAADHQQLQQVLLEIEKLHSQKASFEALAQLYHHLGNLYRLRIEQGKSSSENLMVAILAYQEAIAYDETSPQIPEILNDLGTLYWMLYRNPHHSGDRKAYIEQGIEFYHLALKLTSPQEKPETYTRLQNNLGTAYSDLARLTNPSENWQQAVLAYSEALHYGAATMESLKYAACQNNLGTAYWHLAQHHQPVVNFKKAIALYSQALAQYSPEKEPLKHGMIQNNIGTAYWNLAQYEQSAENLQLAINVYHQALKYRTPAKAPSACAATQNNLATAYWHLATLSQTTKESRQNLLQLSIAAYNEAIALGRSLRENLGFDLFTAYNNVGLAHYQLVTDDSFTSSPSTISQHLEAALTHHLQAINGFAQKSEAYQTTVSYIVKTIRAFHSKLGIEGQNLGLSKVPAQLLPEILPKL
jgi:tetratricopeptide (TPR) repeat protein